MEWISHDDRTLSEHLSGLKRVVDKVIPEKTQNFFSSDELKSQVYQLIAYHDLAKAAIYFQLYLSNALVFKQSGHKYYSVSELKSFIKKNDKSHREWQNNPELKRHALLGAWMSFFRNGKEIEYTIDALLFSKILEYHHGYLKNFTLAATNPKSSRENLFRIASKIDLESYASLMRELDLPFKYGDIQKILDSFKALNFDKLVMGLKSNKDPIYYFKTLFLYSILLSADKGDMMLSDKSLTRIPIPSRIIDEFKAKNIKSKHSINDLREEAYQTAQSNISRFGNQNFFSITLPTGLGKTFTAYKAALKIKEEFCPDFRIVYCLPFTSIIDQNAEVFKDILNSSAIDPEEIGVHHHLAVPELSGNSDDSNYSDWEYFTEGWHNEVTITTFVQLWESLFACHNRQIRKFHNLANSVIILDEVQTINPELYQALEFVMQKMAKYFNTKFVFVTATQPLLMRDEVQELCSKDSEDYFFKNINRTQIDASLLKDDRLDEFELCEVILDRYKKDPQSTLVICNTIRYSQNVSKTLSKPDYIGSNKIYYLSASIIPYSRKLILDEIRERLSNKEPIVLVSTQVVEAGVDIDFNVLYRDFSPLSSINQAAGRCNRNDSKEVSNVFLFKSGKDKIYDPTQLKITQEVLEKFTEVIEEKEFFKMNSQFFKSVKHKIQEGSQISKDLISDILKLKFEDVGTNPKYRLFREEYRSYNFFIPIDEKAKGVWGQYLDLMNIEEHFERKKQIKLFMPTVMKYVIKIPDYVHDPTPEQKEKTVIYDEDWIEFYDEKFGYKSPAQEKAVEIF